MGGFARTARRWRQRRRRKKSNPANYRPDIHQGERRSGARTHALGGVAHADMSADPLAQLYLPRGQYVDCVRVADYCTVTVKETNVFHRQASIRARGLPANTARWQMAAAAVAAHPAAEDCEEWGGGAEKGRKRRERRKKHGEKVRGAADAEEKMMNKG